MNIYFKLQIMTSILSDIETTLEDGDKIVKAMEAFEEDLSFLLLSDSVNCVIAPPDPSMFLDEIRNIYGVARGSEYFSDFLRNSINNAKFSLESHKNRRIISLDCRSLKKGDAFGFLHQLSKETDDLIVVIENVTEIPEGDTSIYDDKIYVENLLIKAWKNEDIFAGDIHINRRKFTIILTCKLEDRDKLMNECGWCSYAWVEFPRT